MTQEELKREIDNIIGTPVHSGMSMEQALKVKDAYNMVRHNILRIINLHVAEVIGEDDKDYYPEHDSICQCPYHLRWNSDGVLRAEQRKRAGLKS